MKKMGEILKVLRMLMIVLSAVLMLSACAPNDEEDGTSPLPKENFEQTQKEATDNQINCWQAGVMKTLYDVMGKTSMEMYSKTTAGAMPLMMIAFAIWFSLRIMKHVSSFTEENIGEVWKEVLGKFFLCFVCGYMASSPSMMLWVLNLFVFPIYNAFLEFGSTILEHSELKSRGGYSGILGTDVTFTQSLVCKPTGTTEATLGGFPEAPRVMMTCMVCSLNERLSVGTTLAFHVLGQSGFFGWIIGIIVVCVFTFVKLGLVFYLVDTLFRMAVMTIILPILVMAYAFKKTRAWTKKGFLIIINSAAFAAAIAILLTTAMLAMEEIFVTNLNMFGDDENAFKELSVTFICILLVCFLIVSAVGVAGQVTDSLVGGKSNPSFQKKLKVVLEMIVGWLTAGVSKGLQKVKQAGKAASKKD